MFSIDGLATGIDTTSIINGLLSIQQNQIERFTTRREDIVIQQTAFNQVETRLLSLQTSIRSLLHVSDSAFQRKEISVSNEDAVSAAVSNEATPGSYQIKVDALALAHQVATQGFESSESEIKTGEFDITVGGNSETIEITESNNTLAGLAQAINDSGLDVTAAIINDGSSGTPFRLLLSSNETGVSNAITDITFTPSGPSGIEPVFDLVDPVQAPLDANITIGTGTGQLSVTSASNQIDDLFPGITLDLLQADPVNEITLTVTQDTSSAETAIRDFADKYNDVVNYIAEQSQFDVETATASVLFGNHSAISIKEQLGITAFSVVPGLESIANRLTAIGISINNQGNMVINSSELKKSLDGTGETTLLDVKNLFGDSADVSDPAVQFVLATDDTQPSVVESGVIQPYKIYVTSAAERGRIVGTNALAASTVIDSTNDKFFITVDGADSSEITITQATYTQSELASHLQDLINENDELIGREVIVSIEGGKLEITSKTYGSTSEVEIGSGNAIATLGFNGDETDKGQDVVGYFDVSNDPGNPIIEEAIGRGQSLIGRADDPDNKGVTEGLQVRVTLDAGQVDPNTPIELSLKRGIGSRLNQVINTLSDLENGALKNISDEFRDRLESIDANIERINEQFESRRESLIRQFASLESQVGSLQSIGNILGAQLASLPRI